MDEDNRRVVVDASFILSFLLKEKPSLEKEFKNFTGGKIDFVSTTLLKYDVGNGLKSAVLKKRLIAKEAKKIYIDFLNFEILEIQQNWIEILIFSFKKNLSFYDASYVLLSKNLKTELLTLDKILEKAR